MARGATFYHPITGSRLMVDRSKGRLTARKVGDWRKAERKMREMKDVYPEAAAVIAAQAQASSMRIKRNIRAQKYNWPPLAESTVNRKRREGLDPRMLIATGQYLDAIQVIPMGTDMVAIGIPAEAKNDEGKSLAMIGLAHEYGLGLNLPPRPHWRREYRVFAGQVTIAMSAMLRTKT
jgi:hypothetical protein